MADYVTTAKFVKTLSEPREFPKSDYMTTAHFFAHPLTLFIPASETTDFYREGVISPPQKIRFSRSLECTKIDATSHT